MSIKDILVHLDGEEADCGGGALPLAIGLAKRHGARLTALFARCETLNAALVAHRASEALLGIADASRAAFETACAEAGLDGRWWQIMHGSARDLVAEVVFCCHYADLVVMRQPGHHVPEDMAEHMIQQSGRPILVAPASGKFTDIGRRAVVGWRAGPEAARAFHDALPLIAGAEKVVVATVGRHGGALVEGQPKVDIIEHLKAHGLPVVGEWVNTDGLKVMDALLSTAYDHDADLLVMGAHGGGTLPLSRSGAGTRHVLAHMNVPVLFSH